MLLVDRACLKNHDDDVSAARLLYSLPSYARNKELNERAWFSIVRSFRRFIDRCRICLLRVCSSAKDSG